MRISDWSSDVCSSDLVGDRLGLRQIESAIEKCALGEFAGARGPRTSGAGRPHQQLECHRAAVRLQLDDVFAGKRMWRGEAQHESAVDRSEEHTSELQSLMRISYAVFCLKKKKMNTYYTNKSQLI